MVPPGGHGRMIDIDIGRPGADNAYVDGSSGDGMA